ncbi:MAG: hypothetical protein PHO83_09405 [Geobacteraceae bacterium]|nr:hypothetical protein [Geobacteraceae bacterium]
MKYELGKNSHFIQILALSIITLFVYMNGLQAGFLAVDDTETIKYIQSGNVSIIGQFLPHGNYYRPLAILSLLADFHLFGGNPAGYHLTNILLHLANSLLVYYLANLLLGSDRNNGIYPFLAALLFALHPVNSEAVVWISARPDLLCCFFLLLCMVLLIKKSSEMNLIVFMGIFLSFFFSLVSKEASLFLPFLSIVYFILERENLSKQNAIAACGALCIAGVVYLLLRNGLPVESAAIAGTSINPENTAYSYIIDGTAAIGFYLRKLLYPFPLNIAITEIFTPISLCFFLLGCVAAIFLWKKEIFLRFPLAFLCTSLFPPLGALFLSLAWTPYAERYLYIPCVAFAICCAIFIRQFFGTIPRFVPIFCIMLLIVPTTYRVKLWTRPIPFWQDAVDKSPNFGTVQLVLAASYLQANRFDEAKHCLNSARQKGLPTETARNFSIKIDGLLSEKVRSYKLSE